MKKIYISIICIFWSINIQADFWSGLKAVGRTVLGAVGGAIIQQSCVKEGYSKEEARQMTNDFFNAVGVNTDNVNKGIDYIEAENKYQKQNIIKDVVFNFAIEATDNPTAQTLLNHYRKESDAQITYLDEIQRATTDEDRKAAFDKRTQTLANLYYDAYVNAKEFHAKRLAEKLKIEKKLVQNGYDPTLAADVAGSILAVQNSDLSENEKKEILRSYDFIGSSSHLLDEAKTITMVSNKGNVISKENTELQTNKKELNNTISETKQYYSTLVDAAPAYSSIAGKVKNAIDVAEKVIKNSTNSKELKQAKQTLITEVDDAKKIEDNIKQQVENFSNTIKQSQLYCTTLFDSGEAYNKIAIDLKGAINEAENKLSCFSTQIVNIENAIASLDEAIKKAENLEAEIRRRENAKQKIQSTTYSGYKIDEFRFKNDFKQALDEIVDIMFEYEDFKIQITGHCCNIGDINNKYSIGLMRAGAVKKYLMEKGIDEKRIIVESKGSKQPIVPNTSSRNRAINRRIEFAIAQ